MNPQKGNGKPQKGAPSEIRYPLDKQRGKRQRLPLSEPQQQLVRLLAQQAVEEHLRATRPQKARHGEPLPNQADLG